ncbi:hypothetical protein Tco_0047419 [Tanacetum coccineum]
MMTSLSPPPTSPSPPPSETTENDAVSDEEDVKFTLMSNSSGDSVESAVSTKESAEVIKSSVEDLVLIPSESEDTSDNDNECDLPLCDNPVTFSNPLLDSNNDFTSNDDESLPEEDAQEENIKIYSNPLFEFDDEYISITHVSELNEDECFDLGGDEMEACLTSDSIPPEINDADFDPKGDIILLEKLLSGDTSSPLPPKELYFEDLKVIKSSIDTPPNFEDDYYDSKGDIIYLESLLIKDTTHNLPPKVFLDISPKSLNNEPDNDDLKNMIKVFDPGIHKKIISPKYVRLPFEDRQYFSLIFVIKIFLPFLTYPMNSLLLFSYGSEDTIFDPDISAYSFYFLKPVVSHRSGTFMCFNVYINILNESPIEI